MELKTQCRERFKPSFGTVGSGSSNGGLFGWLWSLLGL